MITGKEFKKLRHERNMSVEHLSTISGVSVGRIRLIEAGHETTDQRIITALEAALGIESHVELDQRKSYMAGNVILEPCPFCGCEKLFLHQCEYRKSLWTLQCTNCKIEITVPVLRQKWGNVYCGKEVSNRQRLIEVWNRRCNTDGNDTD